MLGTLTKGFARGRCWLSALLTLVKGFKPAEEGTGFVPPPKHVLVPWGDSGAFWQSPLQGSPGGHAALPGFPRQIIP